MRVVQLGEAVKILVQAKLLDRNDMLSPSLSVIQMLKYRDQYAHPERSLPNDVSGGFELEEMKKKIKGILENSPNRSEIRACLNAVDALEHLSTGDTLSPTVWVDAENYMQVTCGGFLGSMSPQGQRVLNAYTGNVAQHLIERRNVLSHLYDVHGVINEFASSQPVIVSADILAKNATCLTPANYRDDILGDRPEPEIEEIISKWMAPEKGSPQISFGDKGSVLVADEISFLARSEACLKDIQGFHGLLENIKREPKDFAKYMQAKHPNGLNEIIIGALGRLEEKAIMEKEKYNKEPNKMLVRAIKLKDQTSPAVERPLANYSALKQTFEKREELVNPPLPQTPVTRRTIFGCHLKN
jgi:hypothetical protein